MKAIRTAAFLGLVVVFFMGSTPAAVVEFPMTMTDGGAKPEHRAIETPHHNSCGLDAAAAGIFSVKMGTKSPTACGGIPEEQC